MSKKIKDEVKKQFDAGFLAVTSYPLWVANLLLQSHAFWFEERMGNLPACNGNPIP